MGVSHLHAGRRLAGPVMLALLSAFVGLSAPGAAGQETSKQKTSKSGAGNGGQGSNAAAAAQFRTAVALQKREQYDLAADEWEAFLKDFGKDPRVASATYNLGLCRFNNKQYAAAADQLARLVKDYPASDKLASGQYLLGVSHFYLGQAGDAAEFAKADEVLEAFLVKNPNAKEKPQALYFAGESKYLQGKKKEAAAWYARLLEEHADDKLAVDALYNLGVAQQETNDWQAAEATFGQFAKQYPQHRLGSEVRERQGEAFFQQGKFAEAQPLFAAAAQDEQYARADASLLRQADCLLEQKQYEQAAKAYLAVPMRFKQTASRLHAQLAAGKCYYLARQFVPAREALHDVLQAKIGDDTREAMVEAGHWAAQCCLKDRKPGEALKIAEALLPQAGQAKFAARLALDRADALFDSPDRRSESLAAYAAVARDFAADTVAPQAQYNAAYAALELQEYATAIEHADAFQRQFPKDELAPASLYVAAEANLLTGKLAEARQRYDSLLATQPAHADRELWQVRRAMSLHLQKQYPAVVESLAPLVGKLQAKDLAAEANYLLGLAYSESKQHEPAAIAFEAALAADAKWRQADETRLALALAWRQLKKTDQAAQQLAELVNREPPSKVADQANYWLAEIAYAAQNFAGAADLYAKTAAQWPKGPLAAQALYGLGWSRLSQSDPTGAAAAFDQLLKNYPQSSLGARPRYARALARRQLEQFAPALEDLSEYLHADLKPEERSEARLAVALCQVGQNDQPGGEATLRKLLADDPGFAKADEALFELAWTLESQGKTDEAAATFAKVASDYEQSPLAAESLFRVGEAHYKEKRYEPAAAAYRSAALKTGADEVGEEASHKLGWSLFHLERFDDARSAFASQRKAFPKGPKADDAAFMVGETHYKQSQYEDALAAYRQAKDPTDPRYAEFALLHAGQAAAFLDRWQESLQILEAAAKRFPESDLLPEILCEQGWAQMHLDKQAGALETLEGVTERTDGEAAARARFLVGEIYFERKQHDEAVKNFFKAAFGYGYPKWQAAAHYEAGRCFEVLKKTKQAIESYQEVVDKFPDSDKAKLAKERLNALKGAS